jgi:hypothetical protein
MKPLYIQGTDDTPRVTLDPSKSVFEFVGNSYPENAAKFYTPILEWIKELQKSGYSSPLTFAFNFDYFNTSSAKFILEILRLVEGFKNNGNECTVEWYYFEDDTDMQEAGEDYQSSISVPFKLIQREDTF